MMSSAEGLLILGVLANQAGLPIPAAPWLVAAGVLAAGGRVEVSWVVGGAVGAALGADLAWYALGRWQGVRGLAALAGILRRSPAAVDRVVRTFASHERRVVWVARFLPELNPIAAGLAGVTHVAPARYLLDASGSALAWVGLWVGAGFLLARAVPGEAEGLVTPVAVLVTIALGAGALGGPFLVRWLGRRPPAGGRPSPARPGGPSRVSEETVPA